jgi:hypothetical protein
VVGTIHGKPSTYKRDDPDDDTYFILGLYNKGLDAFPESDEWRYIVNLTSGMGLEGLRASTGSQRRGGNGAYFEQEYTDGEICVLKETSDHEFEAIERSSSVRFSCNHVFSVEVREDSTCHYIVEVTAPPLCDHPLFKPPIRRKRVEKGLPVVEDIQG